ncbi:lanthionine synthetase [Streptomyces fumigatiscleroticus]|nr:lanthionine synthetase [Streptomyces fumigatiscleroticus]
MQAPTLYYPEIGGAEVEEVIVPLAQYDEEIAGVLRGNDTSFAGRRLVCRDTCETVRKWMEERETYPFQRIIRKVAAVVADADPIAGRTKLFSAPEVILTQLLERTETRLREVYTRPLVAAVNHARRTGRLAGGSPAARYTDFVDRSNRTSFEEASGLSFPVLRHVTRTVLHQEAENFRELGDRLTADREDIAAVFGIERTDPIVSCRFSQGDAHHHGRSVSLIEFASGKRLAYKPRDVSCEAAYTVITRELNRRLGLTLAAAVVLGRNGYGYVEYIEAEDVSEMSADFMRASGELAAVLYLLNARDMHFENIVPTRRGPVPIDLETILHPARIHTGPIEEVPGNAHDTLGQSIYGIGILPLIFSGKDTDAGYVDLGFLGDKGRGNAPYKSIRFENPFTDRVRLVLETRAVAERSTVVQALTEDRAHALGEHMAAGFSKVYRAVMADRGSWRSLVSKAASGARVRYLHNSTTVYAQTLRVTSGASALDDISSYTALLKRIALVSRTSSREIVRSELRQLAERDIPYFTVKATGTLLEDGDGIPVGATLDASPIERALAKTDGMSELDLSEQLRLIHIAFSANFPDNHLAQIRDLDETAQPPSTRRPGRAHGLSMTALLERLCGGLVATSLPDRYAYQPHTWIGPIAAAQDQRPWPPGVLGHDLYTGRVGPALALAAAGRALDHRVYRDLATRIFSATADLVTAHHDDTRGIRRGGFACYTGVAGTLFTLSAAGGLLDNAGWIAAARQGLPLALDQVRDLPSSEMPLDVITGIAGMVPCVIAIGGPHASDAVTTLTSSLVDALHATHHQPVLDQSGFAHGISGIIHALSRAHPWLPRDLRDRVERTLAGLLDRLRRFFDEREGNWFSNVATPQSFPTGWCHGSGGIALALSAYASVSEDDTVRHMRDVAVGNVLRSGFGRNLTWCHGDLGNLDVLTTVAEHSVPSLREQLPRLERQWLPPEVIARKLDDTRSRYSHTNSLMVGTAGIVLHLARRIDRDIHVSPVTLTTGSH